MRQQSPLIFPVDQIRACFSGRRTKNDPVHLAAHYDALTPISIRDQPVKYSTDSGDDLAWVEFAVERRQSRNRIGKRNTIDMAYLVSRRVEYGAFDKRRPQVDSQKHSRRSVLPRHRTDNSLAFRYDRIGQCAQLFDGD